MANALAVLAILLLAASFLLMPRKLDAGFAADVFAGRLPVTVVRVSRKWHPIGGPAWDCTFAIVRLTDSARDLPPSRGRSPEGLAA